MSTSDLIWFHEFFLILFYSLTGMVLANGTDSSNSGHEHSESGLATSSSLCNNGSSTDRVSSSSASSSGLGSSPLGKKQALKKSDQFAL